MLSSRALIVDYNGTFVPGYDEIALAYAFLSRAIRSREIGRALRLAGPLQAKCWYLTLAHKLDEVGKVFAEQVLPGQDPEYIKQVLERPDSLVYRVARKLPKIGTKMDTRPIKMASYAVKQARRKGRKAGIYTASFQEIVEATLRRYDEHGNFDLVYGNPFVVKDGKIAGVDKRVDWADKCLGFKKFLELLRLPQDGSGVIYVGDSPPDKGVFNNVEYPIVAPTAKDAFKEECREDPTFGKRLVVPRSWESIAHIFDLD